LALKSRPVGSAGEGRLSLVLKSGNFGGDDFFERAVDMLGTAQRTSALRDRMTLLF
jgi:hypothetical protein